METPGTPIIVGGSRVEGLLGLHEFEVSLGYMRPYLKKRMRGLSGDDQQQTAAPKASWDSTGLKNECAEDSLPSLAH